MATKQATTILRHLRKMVDKHRDGQTPDRELLQRFALQRDEDAFAALVRRHGQMVLGVGLRVLHRQQDAEDVCQATFLILAQKAGSTNWRDSVASWLYEVAYHLSLKARDAAGRRNARETQVQPKPPADTMAEITLRELQTILDKELSRLPGKYRAPLLLCCLEGKARDEAAECLGWTLAAVKHGLEEGRQLLRRRLARHGLSLPAVLAAVTLTSTSAAAAPLPMLVSNTSRAALQILGGQTTVGVVSANVSALMRSGAHTILLMKLKIAAAVVLLIGALGFGTRILATSVVAATPDAAAAAAPPAAGPNVQAEQAATSQGAAGKKNRDEITVRGRVLDTDGKARAGAKLLLVGTGTRPVELGSSGADGRFVVVVPKDAQHAHLVVRMDGAGVDFLSLRKPSPTGDVVLRLVHDHAIRGRVVTTEGKPAAGVKVRVSHVGVYADDSLETFLVQWKKRHFQSGLPSGVKHMWDEGGALFAATTNADGRFIISSVGSERLVSLRLSGAGIADAEVWVVNRPGFDPKPYNHASRDNLPRGFESLGLRWLLHGPEVSVVAEAERPIRGVVKDIDTGKPRAGVKVSLTRDGNQLLSLPLHATTDSNGRYEMGGARKAKSYMLEVPSDPASGHLACQVRVADSAGYEPITADIAVRRGVIVTGRIIDAVTKKPLPGFAMIGVLSENPFVKKYPEFDSSAWMRTDDTGEDSTFRCVTIPGQVLLMGGLDSRRMAEGALADFMYKPVVADAKYPEYFGRHASGSSYYYTAGGGISHLQGNACKVLEIKPDAGVVTQDLVVEPASALTVKIRDAEGQPLAGTWVTGISPEEWHRPIQIDKDSCPAYHLEPGKARLMVFFAVTQKLAGTLTLKGDEKAPAVVKLGAPGGLKGRLVGEDGWPLANIVVDLHYRNRTAAEVHEHVHRAKTVTTDADGGFQMDGVIPGARFSLWCTRARRTFEPAMKLDDRSTSSGERLDLGEIKLRPKPADRDE